MVSPFLTHGVHSATEETLKMYNLPYISSSKPAPNNNATRDETSCIKYTHFE